MKKLTIKFAGVFVAFAFAVTGTSASAITTQELINLLVSSGLVSASQISALTGSSTGSSAACSVTALSDMTIGSRNAMPLQNFLIGAGYSIPAGATGYFGTQTRAALASYQAANSISPAVGYFGPITRTNISTKCAIDDTTGGTDTTGSDSTLKGGAGDIDVTERSSGVKDEVLEGQEEVNVLGFEIEADGSDVAITSVKVSLEHTGSGNTRLSRYVDEVSIMKGNKVVGSADARDFSKSGDVYSRSLSLSGAIVREDDKERFYVAISAVNNIDSSDLGEDWDVTLTQTRFEDATGAILTDTTSGITETFTFEDLSSSGGVELTVEEGDEDINGAHSVSVDDTSDTNDVEILNFTLKAEGSDIELQSLSFGISATGAGVTEIANDFRLLWGNDEVGTVTVDVDCDGGSDGFASTSDTDICVTVSDLDDDDVVIDEDDEEEFTLVADINDTEGGFASGAKLSVTLNGDVTLSANGSVDADDENGDTLTNSELSGSADSTDIEFLSTGVSVTVTNTNTSVDTVVSDVATDDRGIYTVEFSVTAIEDTAYVELGSATRGTTESNTGVNFVLQDTANSYAATTTGAIALSEVTRVSGGSLSGEFVKISAGQTAKFKLKVTFDPGHVTGTSEGYRLRLYSVNTATSAVDATAQQVLTPEVNYRTGAITIGN